MLSAAPAVTPSLPVSLDAQREAFTRRRFLAMPLAGMLAWLVVALVGMTDLAPVYKLWTLYVATGLIAWLGIGLSYLTGERFLDRANRGNEFDRLFMTTVMMALLAFAVALPFAARDWTAAPLGLGVLAGMMWLPLGWIIRHWIGAFHAFARTTLVLAAWLAWPEQRYVAVPLVIVALYAVTIVVLERRWRRLRA